MKSRFIILAAAAGAALFAGTPKTMRLDWHPTWKSGTVYEVDIDRGRLQKAAKVNPNYGFTVFAEKDGKKLPLEVTHLAGRNKDSVTLRFNVPEGTRGLLCMTGAKNVKIADALTFNNIFSGALDAGNLKNWKASGGVTVTGKSGKIIFKSRSHSRKTVRYCVDLPEEVAGMPVKLELDVKSLAKMTWANMIHVRQLSADGKELSEHVIDPRGTSHMRPPQVLSQYRVEGRLRPDAKKVEIVFSLRSESYSIDNHGLPLADAKALLPELEVSRLVLRAAETLPFPKYNDDFFTSGVSGDKDDLALDLKDGRTFFYQTRSTAAWGGTGKEITDPQEILYPAGDATIEAWFKPAWRARSSGIYTLFNACHHLSRNFDRKTMRRDRHNVFDLTYAPKSRMMGICFIDWTGKKYAKAFKAEFPHNKFVHLAVQWSKSSGIQVFVDGKIVYDDPKFKFTAVDVTKDSYPNHRCPMQFTVGQKGLDARNNLIDIEKRGKYYPMFKGSLDLLRLSSVKRYDGNFTPARKFTVDLETCALFDFDRTFDGKTRSGLKFIPGSCHAAIGRFDNKITLDGKKYDYYPAKLLDEVNPDKVLQANNYPVMPKPADFNAARKTGQVKFQLVPGKSKNIRLDDKVYMDYVEISNTGKTPVEFPLLIKEGEVDARSFGDIRDSLKLAELPERERINKIFQFLLSSSNYFMNHQATFIPGTDTPQNVEYQALMMLNGYCGFECGPLNNLSATLFSTAGYCPATQTAGYGHSFQQVFYDGSNRLYDLSNEAFFPSFKNDQVASLEETEFDVGVYKRINRRSDHFIRLGTRGHSVQVPGYQRKAGYILNPGEKFRYYFYNNGMVNDLQSTTPSHVDFTKVPMAQKYDKETNAKVRRSPIYRVDRFFPHYANGFLTFNGRPSAGNPAFTAVTAGSFCYKVENSYPIVYGEYQAQLADGSFAGLEISTDRGKTFRPLKTDADGKTRATYAVRARREYLIKVNAPIGKVRNFNASTEVMMNPRLLTGKLKKGDNLLLFKAVRGEKADFTLQFRSDVKEIKLSNVHYSGVIPGSEVVFCAVEPGESVVIGAENLSSAATVVADAPLAATLEDGKLTITALKDAKSGYRQVTICDGEAKRDITVLTVPGVRLSGKVAAVHNGKDAVPGADLIQSCAVLQAKDSSCRFTFGKEIPAGEYYVFTLRRMDTYPKGCRFDMLLPDGKYHSAGQAGTSAFDFYDTAIGDGRANFKWDYPVKFRYPYLKAKEVKFTKPAKSIDVRLNGTNNVKVEFAAMMLIPAGDNDLLNDTIKILNGYNCNPFLVNKNNLK